MKKTLYSLMLNDEIVREVDIMAHRLGTNRSSLINEILAEYVNYTTPEKRINDILSAVESLMQPSRDIVPFFTPHSYSMSLKSSLEFKYRPTVKYEVELYRGTNDTLGEIAVIFRTQSETLISSMSEFFRKWKKLEEFYLSNAGVTIPQYELYEGKFIRTISSPSVNCSNDDLAAAISDYVTLFDSTMKSWLSGQYSDYDIEDAYRKHVSTSAILI